jgi:hypothetical protein
MSHFGPLTRAQGANPQPRPARRAAARARFPSRGRGARRKGRNAIGGLPIGFASARPTDRGSLMTARSLVAAPHCVAEEVATHNKRPAFQYGIQWRLQYHHETLAIAACCPNLSFDLGWPDLDHRAGGSEIGKLLRDQPSSITRTRARTPGVEDDPTSTTMRDRALGPTQCGISDVATKCTKGGRKPNICRCMLGADLSWRCVGRHRLRCQPCSRIGENPPYE